MFSHIMIGSNDLERSRAFYDSLSAATGGKPGTIDPLGRLVYSRKGGLLIVTIPIDGEPATVGNGSTIGFAIDDPAQAEAWHAAGLANGGTAIEDVPGRRETPFGGLYLAYLRDPDGNKLCALHRIAA